MAIEYTETPVSVTVGSKEFTKTYQQIVRTSVTSDDILNLLQDPKTAKGLINDWHYGQDLRAKADVRAEIVKSMSNSPEAAFEKAVKEFMGLRAKLNKPVTEDKAREIVKLMQES